MPRSAAALCRIAATVPTPSSTPDAQLLRAFLASGTDDAFTELVRRHGPMVLAVCRRVLSDAHDAEDAFQATFLVLARKAGSMRGTNVAGWLHAVAVRTARGVRLTRDRQRKRDLASVASGGRQPPVLPAPDHDTAAVIDEELAKLPDYYRDAVVLCELRGLSRKDAAAELGIREGTLSSRLAAAKRKLAARLSARGLAGVVLATALAPAAVAADLIEATSVAVRGAAGSAASAAASTVLKGMLFDQLRSTALVAVLVAGVCGALAMTGTPAADESGKAAAPMPDPAAKLVEQLGSADFATREAAEKALKELGMKAEAALRAGLKSDDPEVRARSAAVLKHVRDAELKAFLAGKVEPASPAWKRFKELLGDTDASRKLFAEMMADDRRAQTVERAEANPAKAAEVYAAEVTRLAEVGKKAWDQIVNERPSRRAAPGFPNPHGPALREAITLGDVVAVLFLGTRPLPVGAKDPSTELVLLTSFADSVVGPHKEPFRKLFAAWFDQRRDAKAVEAGLNAALYTGVAEALPTARRLAADGKLSAPAKGTALLLIGNHGTAADDLPLLSAHRADLGAYQKYGTPNGIRESQVRDVAAGVSLLLRGQDAEKYEFGLSGLHVWWLPVNPSTNKAAGSYFDTDEERAAAHKKAWAWLDEQKDAPKKDEPKPDPAVKLVEQLGSADFATREAAEKALQELGPAAKSALLAGLRSEDPEVVRRCGAILPVLRRTDWQRACDAFAKNPTAFDHPVWTRLKAVADDGADARAILADLLADERSFVAISEALDDPKAAERLHRQAHTRLTRSLQDWYTADPKNTNALAMGKWVPERGTYPAMLLLGTFPGAGTEPAHSGDLNALSAHDQAAWSACWFGLCGAGERPQGHALARPSAGVQRLFVAWLGTRTSPKAAVAGLSMLRMLDCREGAALARGVAADHDRPAQDRTFALLYLGSIGNADDAPLAATLFNNANVFQSFERRVQIRDIATAVALKLHGLEPADFDFSCNRGDAALKELSSLGFASDIARARILPEAQAKVEELNRQRAADRLAPPPRPRP